MVSSIKFKNIRNPLQYQLSKDVKEINSSTDVYLPADKTTNLYKISKEDYNKLLKENITANYKKATSTVKQSINREAKKIAKNMN